MDSGAFGNVISTFYSCNTGTGGISSFAQKWVNVTDGWTYAVADGKTTYEFMNDGETFADKFRRYTLGYNSFGSIHYPGASADSKGFKVFTRRDR